MNMFCYQCQEAAGNKACAGNSGVCGKKDKTSNLMDLLIYVLQGMALLIEKKGERPDRKQGKFIGEALFATITNSNFNDEKLTQLIHRAIDMRDALKDGENGSEYDQVTWTPSGKESVERASSECGVTKYSDDEDLRSLKSVILYGIKGAAAYTDHAAVLGHYDDEIFDFFVKALAALARERSAAELTAMVSETGETAVKAMALLDRANTSAYGDPEITTVSTGVRENPGILISGHDLKDMEELLKQTEHTGVDVYTHSEMLPAHYYPAFKKYEHFAGNYGGSWWRQNEEFSSFNGPILMTTNCMVPVRGSYGHRIFTTGMTGYPGVEHIPDREEDGEKDFSRIIELAKRCDPPEELDNGKIVGGFAHVQVGRIADKIVDAVKKGRIRKFVVMAGCDGRQKERVYFTEVAKELPEDCVILTAGCAKYRYIKEELGEISGIPRVLDAGQCNDSYSIAMIALKLKEAFGMEDINDLPVEFDLAWYEQKAVAVFLALVALGFKGVRLGPTLPAFLTQNVAAALVDKFDIKPTGSVREDIRAITT
ncbi:MAG: hydroxylamine reductase [Candidatus Omnitrophica bacterium]|nr:hydroxylamine reductase [Candidatus Omnitrophota bacterium]